MEYFCNTFNFILKDLEICTCSGHHNVYTLTTEFGYKNHVPKALSTLFCSFIFII